MKYKHISAYRVLDKSLNNRLKEVDNGLQLSTSTLKLYGRLMIIFILLGSYGANLIVGLFLRYYNSGVDLSFVIIPDDNRIIKYCSEDKMAAYDILVEIKEDGLRLFSVGSFSFIDEKISLVKE